MAKIKQLENYTVASRAVADFKDKNAKIFAKFDALLIEAGEAESKLKEYVKENIKGNIAPDVRFLSSGFPATRPISVALFRFMSISR